MQPARALSSKVNNNRANATRAANKQYALQKSCYCPIAVTLCGFNDVGRAMTPFLSRWVIFSIEFLRFFEKMKKIYSRSLNFFKKRSIEFPSFDLFF